MIQFDTQHFFNRINQGVDPKEQYRPSKEVMEFLDCTKPIVISCAPRQSGKSQAGAYKVILDKEQGLLLPNKLWWIAGPEYESAAKEFRYIVDAFRKLNIVNDKNIKNGSVKYADKPRNGNLCLVLPNGSQVIGKTCEKPSSLQGESLNGLLMSETAQIFDEQIWHRYLRETLSVRNGRAIFPTTPDVRAVWLRELWEDGEANPDGDIGCFHWPITSNPQYPREKYERDLKRYGYDHPYFQEQNLGLWVYYSGRVYREFQKETHVIEPFDIPNEWRRIRAIDFGHRDPFVCLWLAVGPDKEVFCYREYYQAGLSTTIHARRIQKLQGDEHITYSVADPTARQLIADLASHGVKCSGANNDRDSGKEQMVNYLLPHEGFKPQYPEGFSIDHWEEKGGGYPKLYVFKTCTNTVKEFMNWRWKDPPSDGIEGMKERTVGADHAMDALRYGMMTRPSSYKPPVLHSKNTTAWIHKQHRMERWNQTRIGYSGREYG